MLVYKIAIRLNRDDVLWGSMLRHMFAVVRERLCGFLLVGGEIFFFDSNMVLDLRFFDLSLSFGSLTCSAFRVFVFVFVFVFG